MSYSTLFISNTGFKLVGAILLFTFFAGSCGKISPSVKMPTYLGENSPSLGGSSSRTLDGSQNELRIGLISVIDTSDSDSMPALSPDWQSQFMILITRRTEESLPWRVTETFRGTSIERKKGPEQFAHLARGKELDGILFVLISGAESETPAYFHLVPEVGSLPGFQRQNFSLVEMALLDPSDGRAVLQAQGRAYATLEFLADPLNSNRYPNIRRDFHDAPIYPPPDQALDILRMVTFSDALDQALLRLTSE